MPWTSRRTPAPSRAEVATASGPGEVDDVLLEVQDHLLRQSAARLGDAPEHVGGACLLMLMLEQDSLEHQLGGAARRELDVRRGEQR